MLASSASGRRWAVTAWAALLGLAVAVRFVRLGENPIWLDEANGVLIALRGPEGIVDSLSRDGNPPLYYLLLHAWMLVFGSSEFAVRALSAVNGSLLVAAVGLAGRALVPGRPVAAFAAGAITAVATIHVFYSQEARMYSLTPLIGVGVLVATHRALETGRHVWGVALAGALAAGLYTHNHFLFVLPVPLLAAGLAPGSIGRRSAIRLAGLATLAAALAWSPWIPVLRGQMDSGVGAWIPAIWEATPPALAPVRSFEAMGPGGAFPSYLGELALLTTRLLPDRAWTVVRTVGLALGVLLVGAGLRGGLTGASRTATLRVALLFVVPLVAPWIASFLLRPVYLVGRYELVASVPFALLAGLGVDHLWRASRSGRVAASAAAALWLVCAALALVSYFGVQGFPHELRIAQWLQRAAGPGDVTVFPGYSRAVPEYYLTRWKAEGERVSFPAEVGTHPGWFDAAAAMRDRTNTELEAAELARRLLGTIESGGTVFVVDPVPEVGGAEVAHLLYRHLLDVLGNPAPGFRLHPSRPPSVWVFGEHTP
jgi:4-amino-4-deoxy-L-arabinose transferase-like glycosyltransferase